MRPVLLAAELVNFTDPRTGETRRIPDLGTAFLRRHTHRAGPGIFAATWGEHSLALRRVGRIDGKLLFAGQGSPKILAVLAHMGADVELTTTIPPAKRQKLRDNGLRLIRRKRDGAIVGVVPPVVISGPQARNPIDVGLDGNADPAEEYEEIA